jgi:hypothetical protein
MPSTGTRAWAEKRSSNFAQTHGAVRDCLARHVIGSQRQAAYLAAFYTDAFPVSPRLMWQGCMEAQEFGIRNDLLLAGVRSEGIVPLLRLFQENLAELNEVRRKVLLRAHGAQPVARD